MKIFFYKSILVFFLFLVAFHLSYGYISKRVKSLVDERISRESLQLIKDKMKDEMKVALTKEDYISPEDAKLINMFLEKVKTDLNKNK